MRAGVEWSGEMDAKLRTLRLGGATWDQLASAMELSRDTVLERARKLGARRVATKRDTAPTAPAEPRDRGPRPPGHPATWNALIAGTSLEGAAYPFPVFL